MSVNEQVGRTEQTRQGRPSYEELARRLLDEQVGRTEQTRQGRPRYEELARRLLDEV